MKILSPRKQYNHFFVKFAVSFLLIVVGLAFRFFVCDPSPFLPHPWYRHTTPSRNQDHGDPVSFNGFSAHLASGYRGLFSSKSP
ncbi:hypothetical protein SLA2020_203760 [Shorea laevis]